MNQTLTYTQQSYNYYCQELNRRAKCAAVNKKERIMTENIWIEIIGWVEDTKGRIEGKVQLPKKEADRLVELGAAKYAETQNDIREDTFEQQVSDDNDIEGLSMGNEPVEKTKSQKSKKNK